MNLAKIILVVIAALVGFALFYAYVKYLCEEGYEEDAIHLHLFHDVPLRFLKRYKRDTSYYSNHATYKKSPPEHETVDYDSYPSYYGCNYDPEIAALMNAPAADLEYNNRLLREGGWKCGCGRVNASYVSSCICGRSKYGETVPESVPVQQQKPNVDDPANNIEIANAAAIREYKKLMDDGIITAKEFEVKKKQLLGL
jgi:hypothetical protein